MLLGPWLGRLQAGIGPIAQRAPDPAQSEPDGYEGLSGTGPYDRLLLSEWLLAEEAPMEFDRRAAMGEHAFLALARSHPLGAGHLGVIVDAGPEVLGAPRLAQLAALVVLAQRCAAQGGEIRWVVAQRLDQGPWIGLDPEGIRCWLDARGALPVDDTALEAWLDQCVEAEIETLWWVGGPQGGRQLCRHPQLTDQLSRLIIETPLWAEPSDETPDLPVRILRPGAPALTLTLPGIERGQGARLLRDPFAGLEAQRRQTLTLPGRVQSPNLSRLRFVGTRLLGWVPADKSPGWQTEGWRPLAWHVPNSPHARPHGRTRQFPEHVEGKVVAVGFQGRSYTAVTADADWLTLWWKGQAQQQWPLPEDWVSPQEPLPLVMLGRWPSRAAVLDGEGRLYLLQSGPDPECTLAAHSVIAAESIEDGFVVVSAPTESEIKVHSVGTNPRNALVPLTFEVDPDPVVFVGNPHRHGHPTVAVRSAASQWLLVRPRRSWEDMVKGDPGRARPSAVVPIHVDPEHRVVGVIADYTRSYALSLLVHPEATDARALWRLSAEGNTTRVPLLEFTDEPIDQVAVDSMTPRVAVRSSSGWLKVIDLGRSDALLLDRMGDTHP